MREHISIVARHQFEFVGRADERQLRDLRDLGRERLGEAFLGVEAGADRGAALRQRIKLLEAKPHALLGGAHLRGVAGELLAERQRRRVHRMGAADLDDAGEFLGLCQQSLVQMRERRQQQPCHAVGGGDMHRRREAVVRRLPHIDVVVRMHRRLCAELAAEHEVGAVGDHLVDVHVGLRAGAGLPDPQREMIVEIPERDVARDGDDRAGAALVENAERTIHVRRRPFDDAERVDDRARHQFIADQEVAARALGLRAPVLVGNNVERTERVAFGPRRCRVG